MVGQGAVDRVRGIDVGKGRAVKAEAGLPFIGTVGRVAVDGILAEVAQAVVVVVALRPFNQAVLACKNGIAARCRGNDIEGKIWHVSVVCTCTCNGKFHAVG